MRDVIGNRQHLFKGLGELDCDKCIQSIFRRAGDIIINIDEINKAANEGSIYVQSDGRILDTYKDSDAKIAKYRIVATGLTVNGTKYPLFASFMKYVSTGIWQGAYIATGEEMFKMYKEHYSYPEWFDNQYIDVFCGSGIYMDLVGKGLDKVLRNNAPAKYIRDSVTNIEDKQTDTKTKEENIKTEEVNTKIVASEEKIETKECNEVEEEFNLETLDKYDDKVEVTLEQGVEIANAAFVQELYNQMIYKEKWMVCGPRRLDFYIRNLIKVLEKKRESDNGIMRGNGYLYSKGKQMCILNLGLINVYGNDIYILDASPNIPEFKHKQLSVLQSKMDMLNAGFTPEELKNLPDAFSVQDLYSECIFDAEFEDFDFLDTNKLYHIIEERRSRFPKEFADTPARIICDKIKEAIRLAIKISKTDIRYVVPKYDFERDTIQFMIPFHINSELCDVPELVLIVGKMRDVWYVYTILDMVNAIADARILFRPKSWLREN